MNRFPDNFLWGAATSSHQVEGDNSNNDWWEWEQSGNTEPSGKACDHYSRFRDDFKLIKAIGHNSHRLGLEWSRLEKKEGQWEDIAWCHYHSVIDELLSLGIEPVVTLNHFTLPAWIAHAGGWTNSDTVDLFIRFSAKVMQEFGSKVRYWITINEPHILAFLSYFTKEWPPCRNDMSQALKVLRNLLLSHVEVYQILKDIAKNGTSYRSPVVGIAKAVTAFHPDSLFSPLDRLMAYLRSDFHNHAFIRSLLKGRISIPGIPCEKLSARETLDFIGINYYFRQFIGFPTNLKKDPFGEVRSTEGHSYAGPLTDMGWEIYPEGIYEVIRSLDRYGLPIMVTENGLATTDDTLRCRYIKDHLTQVLKAINKGSRVIGYMHWSLMDNFEWAEGYSKRFGLIEVDFKTQKRTVRDSARYYKSVIHSGQIQP